MMRTEMLSQIPSYFPELGRNSQNSTTGEGQNTYNETIQQVSKKKLGKFIEHGNQLLENSDTRLEITFHELTNRMMVTLIDKQTNKVVMEIPPKKWVDLVYNLCEQIGIFVDTKFG